MNAKPVTFTVAGFLLPSAGIRTRQRAELRKRVSYPIETPPKSVNPNVIYVDVYIPNI